MTIQYLMRRLFTTALILVLLGGYPPESLLEETASPAALSGKVVMMQGRNITVRVDSGARKTRAGDRVELSFTVDGETIPVGSWQVTVVGDDGLVEAEPLEAGGEPNIDMDARIFPGKEQPGEPDKQLDQALEGLFGSTVQPQTIPFIVETNPPDARVRIMNIKPKYRDGIELNPGSYRIEVTKPGFRKHLAWFKLTMENSVYPVTLAPLPEQQLFPEKAQTENDDVQRTSRSIDSLFKKARAGDARAQNDLGVMYRDGSGLNRDAAEALKWLGKAAEQGYAEGQFNLGKMHHLGLGISKDAEKALRWYRKAVGQGNAKAQNNLGTMYRHGEAVRQDYREAVWWFRKAAEQGVPQAQLNLALAYVRGQGIEQDYTAAFDWFHKAAVQGLALGQLSLGYMYSAGRGVRQDHIESVKWYRKAAEQGDAQAQTGLANKYRDGEGVRQNDWQAVHWYRMAAEQDFANAQYNLGVMYERGNGVSRNPAEAAKWYRKAADQGHKKAQERLTRTSDG